MKRLIFNKGAYGLPKKGLRNFLAPLGKRVVWTYHARLQAEKKGVNQLFQLPKFADIVEIEVNQNTAMVEKWIIRVKRHDGFHVYVVVYNKGFRVVTCWINRLNDNHKTLHVEAYDNPNVFTPA